MISHGSRSSRGFTIVIQREATQMQRVYEGGITIEEPREPREVSEQGELFGYRPLIWHKPRRPGRQTAEAFRAKVAATLDCYRPGRVDRISSLDRAKTGRVG